MTSFSDRDQLCECAKCGSYRFTGTAEKLLELHGNVSDRAALSLFVNNEGERIRPEKPFVTEQVVQQQFGLRTV